eukprot:5253036-Pyramimonas_sp.AAC.1
MTSPWSELEVGLEVAAGSCDALVVALVQREVYDAYGDQNVIVSMSLVVARVQRLDIAAPADATLN